MDTQRPAMYSPTAPTAPSGGNPSYPLLQSETTTATSIAYAYEGLNRPPVSYTFYGSNSECFFCGRPVDETKTMPIALIQTCGHVYHVACGRDFLDREDGKECPRCVNKMGPIAAIAEEVGQEANYDDHELKERLAYNLGLQDVNEEEHDEEYYKEEYGTKSLSLVQKGKLLKGTKNRLKNTFGSKIDFNTLLDNDRTMEDLLGADLNLLDMYFSLEITEWSELMELGMHKRYLSSKKGDFMPLEQLIDLYFVNYDVLRDSLGWSISDSIRTNFTAYEMKRLGMDFEAMLKNGLEKNQMRRFGYKVSEWIVLGMEKRHLLDLRINATDISMLKWNVGLLSSLLKLDQNEKDSMGITAILAQQVKQPTRILSQRQPIQRPPSRMQDVHGHAPKPSRKTAHRILTLG